MSGTKDPSIKLFGKMIQVGSNLNEDFIVGVRDDVDYDCESTSSDQNFLCSKQDENRGYEEATTEEEEEEMDTKEEEEEEEPSLNSVLQVSKTPTSPSNDTTKHNLTSSQKKDQDQSDQGSSNSISQDQNPLKKPDKIIPCARCSSMDTKFCYFNNYNVNQPRHFCKNCQRYWTAGGSMRNVPVGAGRRKSKNNTISQHQHLMIPGSSDGLIHHVMRPDGTVLAFGLDSSVRNEVFMSENEKNTSISFSNSSSISIEKNGNSNNGGTKPVNSLTVPCFPWFPMSFYPSSSSSNSATPCNLQWLPTISMNSDQCSSNSTSLGKHSREETTLKLLNPNNKDLNSRIVIPKTLRIDDPSEAAKSSIWTTLGIKNEHHIGSSNARVAFFGDLQQAKGINPVIEPSSLVKQANPIAFSRSLAFHEVAQ